MAEVLCQSKYNLEVIRFLVMTVFLCHRVEQAALKPDDVVAVGKTFYKLTFVTWQILAAVNLR